jgi:hypothetical protein
MTILAILVCLLVLVLAAAILFRDRIAMAALPVTWIVFVVLALIALSAVFVPGIYESAAENTLSSIGLTAQIQQLDDQLSAFTGVAAAGSDLLSRLRGALGDQTVPQLPAPPSGSAGMVSNLVMPGLTSLLATIYRIAALIIALSALVALVALNYAAYVINESRRLSTTVTTLESRMERLEAPGSVPEPRSPLVIRDPAVANGA